MKIYTRTGDDGTTGLLGARRVGKDDVRVEAYGTVDELNACLGVASAAGRAGGGPAASDPALLPELERIQARLFQVGAELAATDEAVLQKLSRVADDDVTALEHLIDRLEEGLPPLTQFILPGGTPLAAELHHARTVCRRAERRVVTLSRHAAIEPRLVRYLNRLADLLFVMARAANARAGVRETTWNPKG